MTRCSLARTLIKTIPPISCIYVRFACVWFFSFLVMLCFLIFVQKFSDLRYVALSICFGGLPLMFLLLFFCFSSFECLQLLL